MTKRSILGLQVFCAALALALAPEPAAAQQSGSATGIGTDNGHGTVGAKSPPPPFPSFEARRVTAPKPGTPPKITIQITEPAPLARVTSPEITSGPAGEAAEVGRYGWFWQRVPAGLEGKGQRNRLENALAALQTAPTPVSTPGLQLMQQIIQEQAAPILLSSAGTKVSPALVLAVIAVESSGESDAVSSAGAGGLMQLMPDTAARFGVDDALNAAQNISGGIKYLDWLLEEFSGDAVLALAGYNAGEGAVRAHQGVPPFAETRDYVPKVLAAYQVARALCLTPPELISDGCVFRQLK